MSSVFVQVTSQDGTGFLPEMGQLPATRFETEEDSMFRLDDSVPNYGGQVLTASQVEVVQ